MQDNTYLPRNFATLGSLELQPPVFTDYIQSFSFILLNFPFVNLGKSHCAYFITNFAHSCVYGRQLQGSCCRVPFKWFFASLLFFKITCVSFSMVLLFPVYNLPFYSSLYVSLSVKQSKSLLFFLLLDTSFSSLFFLIG